LEEEGACDIIDGADQALGFPILLGSIGARHAEGGAMSKEESTRGRVVKLAAVVTLDCFNGAAKLGRHMSEEIRNCGKCIRLSAKGKSPKEKRAIIKND
jgi:hypothetical protein